MTVRFTGIFFSLILIGVFLSSIAVAHVGHKKEEAAAAPADSIYSMEEGEAEPAKMAEDDLFGSPLSRSDLQEMEMDFPGHKESMQEIKLAEHEWVSPSQKGYGMAIGITVLSGLVFGFLSYKRPGE